MNFCRTLSTVNISEMADKEKRLQKILAEVRLKGKLKSVKTLEEASIVIADHPSITTKILFFDKNEFKHLSIGKTFSEDEVYFLVATNPRNKQTIERSILLKYARERKLYYNPK